MQCLSFREASQSTNAPVQTSYHTFRLLLTKFALDNSLHPAGMRVLMISFEKIKHNIDNMIIIT